jgi:serine protease Do
MNKPGTIVITALLSGALAIGSYRFIENRNSGGSLSHQENVYQTSSPAPVSSSAGNADFVSASTIATPAIVHIRVIYSGNSPMPGFRDPLEDFFGIPEDNIPVRGSGSGVIIAGNGYIATNNHVIDESSEIEVVLTDKRTFRAKLVGTDPNTDLALIKVDAKNLPVIKMGNSDDVQVGEWVLAVGYPLSLNATVTAGIISAKGRSIGIIGRSPDSGGEPAAASSSAVESFIQTDAAINPGNSGGALVNTNGELIGINTAIASQTGSYAGYGFAIPVNLAKKVFDDLMKYGTVKRGFLGITFPNPAAEEQFLKEKGIRAGAVQGVYIIGVQSGSAAASAGLKVGDVVQKIDGTVVGSSAELSERIARHRPGDKVQLGILRGNKSQTVNVTLRGAESARLSENIKKTTEEVNNKLGASFLPVSSAIKQRYRINSGVVVSEVYDGGFFDQIGIPRGTVITTINGKPVNNTGDVGAALNAAKNGMLRLDGISPDGSRIVFTISLGA